jgi:hypothetical protein
MGGRGISTKRLTLWTRVAAIPVLAVLMAGVGNGVSPVPASASGSTSESNGYSFLDQMMDKYATGTTLRLVQSFTGGHLEKVGYTDSVTYDDALIIDALLARGTPDDVSRAETIGNALLYVQANDPAHDGRIRAAYKPDRLTSPDAVTATDSTSDVGNMAWVGQALLQLYARTGVASYLTGATSLAQWIQTNAYDTRGAGGYTGGDSDRGARITWKSTEHNIDVYALFTMLATESGNAVWTTRAAWAKQFVEAMWDPAQGRFYVGTLDNGVSINNEEQPEDVNSWSYLALEDPAYAPSITWDVHNLAVTAAKGFSGVSVCLGDRSGVWFEGTAHLAEALQVRQGAGDQSKANAYLSDIAHAQVDGKNADGLGIIAASKNGLSDCDGDKYYASLHTGATAWYLLALQDANPFHVLAPPA